MGAEYVLPGNTAVRELVERFGLGLWDKGMRYGWRDPRGGIGTTHEELAGGGRTASRRCRGRRRAAERSGRSSTRSTSRPGAREAILARVEISSANARRAGGRGRPGRRRAHRRRARAEHRGRQPAPAAGARRRAWRRGATWRPLSTAIDWGEAGVRVTAEVAKPTATLRDRGPGQRARPDRVRTGAARRRGRRARASSSTATPRSCSSRCARRRRRAR